MSASVSSFDKLYLHLDPSDFGSLSLSFLQVPFALTAGLSGVGNSRIVVLAGLAELIGGSFSMGLGGCKLSKCQAEVAEAQFDQNSSSDLPLNTPSPICSSGSTTIQTSNPANQRKSS